MPILQGRFPGNGGASTHVDFEVIQETARTCRVVHSGSAKAFSSLSKLRVQVNDQQKKEQQSGVRDQEIRAALNQHWAASDANDFDTEHRIYHEDAVLEYPQSGERTRSRRNLQNQRASQPSNKRFSVRRIVGATFGLPNSS